MVWVKLNPLASTALTACSVTRPTSLTNSSPLRVSAASRPLDFSSTISVISTARWRTVLEISSALPTKLRATSALTESSMRSTSPAFCLSTLLTPVDTAVNARSTSPAFCLIWPLAAADAAISERSSSAAPCLRVVVMPVLTVATDRSVALRMVLTTRSASVPARPNSWTASFEFDLMDSANDAMRTSRASATDLVRDSTCSLIASMRPTHRFSNRPITWPSERSVSPEILVMVRSAVLVTWVRVRSAAPVASLSTCAAVVELVSSVVENCSMRFSISSVTARVRVSIWLEIASVRLSHRFS